MSHITRIKTQLVELELVKLALLEIECEIEEGENLKVSEVTAPIMMKILFPGQKRAVALVRDKDGKCSLAGDATVMKNITADQHLAKLHQRYAYHTVKQALLKQGFQLEQELVSDKNEIHLTLRRMS